MKPQAPDDLWEQMDALHEEMGLHGEDVQGGFAVRDYASHYSLSYPAAQSRVNRLVLDGKLEHVGYRRVNGSRMKIFNFKGKP